MYCTRKHAFGVVIEITLKEGRFPNLSVLNKGRDIVFDIFLRSCYPFSSPQVFCATEVIQAISSFLSPDSMIEETFCIV